MCFVLLELDVLPLFSIVIVLFLSWCMMISFTLCMCVYVCVCVCLCVCVCVCVCMCVFYRPPILAVCPNHEAVVFQPWTMTAPDLVCVSNITTILALRPHLCPTMFWIFIFPSPRTYLISIPHISPVDDTSLSLCILFFPPPSHLVAK